MKIGVLTSSRADFGIYTPLLKAMLKDDFFNLEIIAFGTHLSAKHGNTITEIESNDFKRIHKVKTPTEGNTPKEIAKNMGETTSIFSIFWAQNKFDLIFTLGDRFEMFSAVIAASPFILNIAHLHAGETTLGAIDNAYRHSISLFCNQLFVSSERYKTRALEICEKSTHVYNVGALSIDNLKKEKLYSKEEFKDKFQIDLNKETILATFHPETVSFEKNKTYIKTILESFKLLSIKYQIVLTMPNMDTMGQVIRAEIKEFQEKEGFLILIESFGMKGYLSCMKYCNMMLGNTSSGFTEASFFPTKVINLGSRQDGRIRTPNILDCKIEKNIILESVEQMQKIEQFTPLKTYGEGNTAQNIIEIIKGQC